MTHGPSAKWNGAPGGWQRPEALAVMATELLVCEAAWPSPNSMAIGAWGRRRRQGESLPVSVVHLFFSTGGEGAGQKPGGLSQQLNNP